MMSSQAQVYEGPFAKVKKKRRFDEKYRERRGKLEVALHNLKEENKRLQEAERRAESMNRLKESLLANLSHEIRTPLNGIIGFSQLLREQQLQTEAKVYLDGVHRNSQRLLTTLDSILDLALLDSKKNVFKPQIFDFTAIAKRVAARMAPRAQEKGLKLHLLMNEEELTIESDPYLLEKMMLRLLDNAIKFTEIGDVTMACKKNNLGNADGFTLSIKIVDTGIGVSDEFVPYLFEEFQQESSGYSRSHEGIGLGLTLVKKSAELLGGTLTARTFKNLGSTFHIEIPCIAPGTKRPLYRQVNIPRPHLLVTSDRNDRIQLLVVEDDLDNQEIIRHHLQHIADVSIVAKGQDAIEASKKRVFDLILMDINLGLNLDGLQTMRKIRQISGYEFSPVIALTAYAMNKDGPYYIDQGFSDYLCKPFTRESLQRMVRKFTLKASATRA